MPLSRAVVMRKVRAALRAVELPMTRERRETVLSYLHYIRRVTWALDTVAARFLVWVIITAHQRPVRYRKSLAYVRACFDAGIYPF